LEYIKQDILKLITYFLYGNTEIELSKIVNEYEDLFSFITEAQLEDSFYFKINKNQVNKNPELFNCTETIETDTIIELYQKVKSRIDDKEIIFSDVAYDYLDLLYTSIFYNINIYPNRKVKLLDYLNNYIESFQNNTLDLKQNYYDFGKSLQRSVKIFEAYYNKFGKRFRFSGFEELDSIKEEIESELRIYEVILYFQKKKYININNFNFMRLDDRDILSILLIFNKSPDEIFNIEKEQIKLKNKKLMELKLKFDPDKCIISYEGKTCDFNKWDNQGVVLKTIFDHEYGVEVDVEEIRSALDIARIKEEKRTIYDAVIAINKKAEQGLHLKPLLVWQKSTVKINDIFDI
jgi:hypothetical protein